jgi:hypothetical protein
MKEEDKTKIKEDLFFHLVFMFQTAALQQMGKLVNPITKKAESNLEQAKYSIDILELLQEKTKGNLKEEEEKYLENVLFELRMNYLEEVKKEKEPAKEEEKKPPESKEEG